MDSVTLEALSTLALPNLLPISREELEEFDPELKAVECTRTTTEYYWTATPVICLFTLDRNPEIDHVVHLDADVEFSADPAPVWEELSDGSILLTPHRPAPEFTDGADETGGYFNVQFEVFRRDTEGTAALKWWRERCLEWCHDRFEPDRYGDQKYLERLPQMFTGVRECLHPGAGLAPWNIGRHRLERRDGHPLVDGERVLFHHYQSLELYAANGFTRRLARWSRAFRFSAAPVAMVWTTGWRLTDEQLAVLWEPYVARLSCALADLRLVVDPQDIQLPPPSPRMVVFQIARRHVPIPVRSMYWWGWQVALRLRSKRRSHHPDAAAVASASATCATSASDNSG